jgi:hypothetical protein
MQLVRQAGKKTPFRVTEMKQTNFFQFSDLIKNTLQMKKVNDVAQKIEWKDIKWLRFIEDVGRMYYKDSFAENAAFSTVCWRHRGKGHVRRKSTV